MGEYTLHKQEERGKRRRARSKLQFDSITVAMGNVTQCFDCVNVSNEQCKSPSSSRRRAAAQTRTVTVASSASEQILKVDDKGDPMRQ